MSKRILTPLAIVMMIALLPTAAFAQDGGADGMTNIAKALLLGLAGIGGTLAQGKAASAALEGICRNPNAASTVTTPMILGLSFIESLVIFALVVVFTM